MFKNTTLYFEVDENGKIEFEMESGRFYNIYRIKVGDGLGWHTSMANAKSDFNLHYYLEEGLAGANCTGNFSLCKCSPTA